MRGKANNPRLLLGAIIMITSLACGGTTQVVTQTPLPPRPTPTAALTYTPYPTYTPVPSPTIIPSTPPPTSTEDAQTAPTDTSSTIPVNCVASTISGYYTCMDETGYIQVDVLDTWADVNGTPWTYDGQEIGLAISAAPNLLDYQTNFDAEGMFFGASDTFAQIGGYIEFLDIYSAIYKENCTYVGRGNYDDGVYRGRFYQFSDCGGSGGYAAYVLSAVDKVDQFSKIILVIIQISPNDTEIVEQIWSTFYVYF